MNLRIKPPDKSYLHAIITKDHLVKVKSNKSSEVKGPSPNER